METINYFGILYLIGLIVPILMVNKLLNIKMNKDISISIFRMVIQLSIVGLYLQYLFELNNTILNISYIILMIVVATFSTIKSSGIKLKSIFVPIFLSMLIPSLATMLFFNKFVISLSNIFEARYIITIGGMLLGNVLSGEIVGVNTFYKGILDNQSKYSYDLSLGATKFQAIKPYLQAAIKSCIKPTVASMATIGLVSLPGMMTGQILGGSVPAEAIMYQIAIMIAIFISRYFSILFAILFSLKTMFDIKENLAIDNFKDL